MKQKTCTNIFTQKLTWHCLSCKKRHIFEDTFIRSCIAWMSVNTTCKYFIFVQYRINATCQPQTLLKSSLLNPKLQNRLNCSLKLLKQPTFHRWIVYQVVFGDMDAACPPCDWHITDKNWIINNPNKLYHPDLKLSHKITRDDR